MIVDSLLAAAAAADCDDEYPNFGVLNFGGYVYSSYSSYFLQLVAAGHKLNMADIHDGQRASLNSPNDAAATFGTSLLAI